VTQIQSCEDDVCEIDVKPDGSWRVKGGAKLKDLARWHLPDGTLCVATSIGSRPNTDIVKEEIKEVSPSEQLGCRIKLGIRKNNNGKWEITKRGDVNSMPSSDNDQSENFENGNSVSSTSNIDLENTEDSEPGQCVHDLDSSPVDEHVPPVPIEQDIIVLSDSDDDDDNVMVLSSNALNCNSADYTGDPFPPNPPKTSGTSKEQPDGAPVEASFLMLTEDFEELGLPFWGYPSNPQDDPAIESANGLGEVQNFAANHQSLLDPVSGVNSVATPAANLLEDGHDSSLQAPLDHSCAGRSLSTANNVSRKRTNPGDEITALDGMTEATSSF
jgi:E3 SUMO-protein ligase PIAS1